MPGSFLHCTPSKARPRDGGVKRKIISFRSGTTRPPAPSILTLAPMHHKHHRPPKHPQYFYYGQSLIVRHSSVPLESGPRDDYPPAKSPILPSLVKLFDNDLTQCPPFAPSGGHTYQLPGQLRRDKTTLSGLEHEKSRSGGLGQDKESSFHLRLFCLTPSQPHPVPSKRLAFQLVESSLKIGDLVVQLGFRRVIFNFRWRFPNSCFQM